MLHGKKVNEIILNRETSIDHKSNLYLIEKWQSKLSVDLQKCKRKRHYIQYQSCHHS